jgi:uncharacterized protein (DUF1684 family)
MLLQKRTVAVLAAVLGSSIPVPIAAVGPEPDWRAAAEAWRAKQEQDLRAPDGWLAVAGLFFLKPGLNRVGADPASDVVLPEGAAPADAGVIVLENGIARFEPRRGVAASLNAQPIGGPVELRPANSAGKRAADRVTVGRVAFHLHHSGPRLAIRLRDPGSALRTGFTGLRWFPLDERWRVNASFVAYDTPRRVEVQKVLGDVEASVSPGEAHFVVNGQAVRLVAFTAGNRLWFVFRDATASAGAAGPETYATRFLYADAPDAQGRVLLDFNRAYNPPCAYNPNTTCPLPVAQNRLKLAIPAGEKRYAAAPAHRTAGSEPLP